MATKLSEGELLAVIAALGVNMLTAINKARQGSNMRLMKKLFQELCLKYGGGK